MTEADPREFAATTDQDLREAASDVEEIPPSDAAALMMTLTDEDAARLADYLDPETASRILTAMDAGRAADILQNMHPPEASMILAAMDPDDRVDVLEHLPYTLREQLVAELPPDDAAEVRKLAQYPPDTAGGIMTTQVTALSETLTVEQAIGELRRLHDELEQIYYVYVVDEQGRLAGVLSMRDVILARPETPLSRVARRTVVSVPATMDQEHVARLIRDRDFLALPVVDDQQRLIGIITVDDVVDVAAEEATEDIHKLGGSEALAAPYLDVGYFSMIRKRGGWLTVLFVGQLFTATAMGIFENELERALVLAIFLPMIIASGGNTGSQAATIIVRSLALTELTLRDWWRVLTRELRTGLTLGAWLGGLSFLRVALWHQFAWKDYGEHYLLVAATVGLALTGVVAIGSLTGSMLPFIMRRLGFDPATSSTPFVATLVDVTGVVIYFLIAIAVLSGTLL